MMEVCYILLGVMLMYQWYLCPYSNDDDDDDDDDDICEL